jgi:hypothetical protein
VSTDASEQPDERTSTKVGEGVAWCEGCLKGIQARSDGRDSIHGPSRDSKVLRSLRRGVPLGGCTDILTPIRAPKANAFAERWAHGPDRMPGLDAGLRPAPLGAGAPSLRLALQRGQAQSGSRAEDAEPEARSVC